MEEELPSPSLSSLLHLKSTTSDDIVCHRDHDDAAAAADNNHQEQISLYGSSFSQASTVQISNVAPERRDRMQQIQKVSVSCQQQAVRTCKCVRDWHSRTFFPSPDFPE